ncbi:GNAT family protein [uncultured Albimonas sp.]|uniref:GNAT family N-acetyltransferase n=1 Tax=uncultured Albimonas sp. TaxID=1331701 RepID=UPI0030EC56B3|tara:strand:- start:1111 stop:1674 length:564 start_codon:yes stop_codon:yes gene_type:complete
MLDGLQIAPLIEADRMVLRPPRRRDAGLISLYLSDARAAKSLALIPHPYPPGAAEQTIERALAGKRSGPLYVMDATRSDGPEMVGLVFLNKEAEENVFQVSYVVGPAFRNTGYATEAVVAVRDHLFEAGARALTAKVYQDNAASAHVLTRAGLDYQGEGEAYSAARGAVAPTWRYRLERDRWLARSS